MEKVTLDKLDTIDILECVINQFEGLVDPLTHTKVAEHYKKGAYAYIPYNTRIFLLQLYTCIRSFDIPPGPNRLKFVDIGCGLGTKVAIARRLGCDAHGIEINREYAKVAWRLMANGGVKTSAQSRRGRPESFLKQNTIICSDATKVDLSTYDILYLYNPQCNHDLEVKLESHVMDSAKVGALIIANCFQWQRDDPRFEPFDTQSRGIWRKVKC